MGGVCGKDGDKQVATDLNTSRQMANRMKQSGKKKYKTETKMVDHKGNKAFKTEEEAKSAAETWCA